MVQEKNQRLLSPVSIKDQEWPEPTTPVVSICCITYNQEEFIRECLESLVVQRTTFPVEILVHDDASTDNTANIIREFEKRYPDVVKPIIQEVNQFSQGKRVNLVYNFPRAVGAYIALCEGDDYWIDQEKLELQVAALEKNQTCDLCFHPALVRNHLADSELRVICRHAEGEKIISIEDVIAGGGGFCPTASLLFRTKVVADIPDWVFYAPVGDFYMQVMGSMRGGALYLDREMSVYRTGLATSWTKNKNKY
ncbi:MAG: hypothetical protein C0616_00330, partial [Desulfuromonas sp.]